MDVWHRVAFKSAFIFQFFDNAGEKNVAETNGKTLKNTDKVTQGN